MADESLRFSGHGGKVAGGPPSRGELASQSACSFSLCIARASVGSLLDPILASYPGPLIPRDFILTEMASLTQIEIMKKVR